MGHYALDLVIARVLYLFQIQWHNHFFQQIHQKPIFRI